jgi:uncharacterized protein YjbI with pentapeptide repeats
VAQLQSTASYWAHDLSGIGLRGSNLFGANFAGQNLTDASFAGATLTGANLTGAEVRGADFSGGAGISLVQLYSTASYQAHDLTGIGLGGNLAGANLSNQNLTNASVGGTLTNANFSQANLTNVNFYGANLDGANLTGAEVRRANFSYVHYHSSSSFTAAQLYSTASYQNHDLSGISLNSNDLSGWNFAGQKLTNAGLSSSLSGANFSQANLTNASLYHANLYRTNFSQANLTNADFNEAYLFEANVSAADSRGASLRYSTLLNVAANTTNLIQSTGHIAGLYLTAGASLVIRDYDGNPAASPPTGPLPIVVDQHLAMDAAGTLRLVFDADAWDSTISFAPGASVARGGTLDLSFAAEVHLGTQIGRTIDLFDWTGVTPTGTFNIISPYTWNLSNLYTTGEVTLTAVPGILPGDFNNDSKFDAADYIMWRKNGGTAAAFDTWRTHFGQPAGSGAAGYPLGASAEPLSAAVPEPATLALLAVGLSLVVGRSSWRPSIRYRRAFQFFQYGALCAGLLIAVGSQTCNRGSVGQVAGDNGDSFA